MGESKNVLVKTDNANSSFKAPEYEKKQKQNLHTPNAVKAPDMSQPCKL